MFGASPAPSSQSDDAMRGIGKEEQPRKRSRLATTFRANGSCESSRCRFSSLDLVLPALSANVVVLLKRNTKSWPTVCWLFCWLALAPVACSPEQSLEGSPPLLVDTRTIVIVNAQPIGREEFAAFVKFLGGEGNDELEPKSRKALFRQFLLEQVLLQEAERKGVMVEENEVWELKEWGGDQEIDEDEVDRVRDFLTIQKLIRQEIGSQLQVSLQEIEQYYEQHQKEFVVEDRAHVVEILVDDQKSAQAIRQKLLYGDIRIFKSIARERSKGVSAQANGDLGFFQRGDLPEEFERVIFALKPGEVSSVFQSSYGYHLFMMEEWIPRHPQKFHEVQEKIFKQVMAEKERDVLANYLKQLSKTASIDIQDPSLTFDWRDGDDQFNQ